MRPIASEDGTSIRGPTLDLVPLGGLGNRLRFVNSAIHAVSGQRRVVIVNFNTDMFPGNIADFLRLPAHVGVVELRFRREKLLIQLCKVLTLLSVLSFGRIARYGARVLPPNCRLIASYITLDGMDIAHVPLKEVTGVPEGPHNAVHIRGTDNAHVIALNPPERFEAFIAKSRLPVYLATDSDATKARFRARFGDKILTRQVGLRRDSAADLEAAFEELWCLIRARKLCRSKSSSFSTIAITYRRKLAEDPPDRM
jgi:hypothetical protein